MAFWGVWAHSEHCCGLLGVKLQNDVLGASQVLGYSGIFQGSIAE